MVEMSLIHMFLLYRLLLGIVQKELLTAFWGISKEPPRVRLLNTLRERLHFQPVNEPYMCFVMTD